VVAAALKAAEALETLYRRLLPSGAADYYGGVLRVVRWTPVRRVSLYIPARYISTLEHFYEAVKAGADAILAASLFHFRQLTIRQVKQYLRERGAEVRP
jgi:histidinol dehydrogenase